MSEQAHEQTHDEGTDPGAATMIADGLRQRKSEVEPVPPPAQNQQKTGENVKGSELVRQGQQADGDELSQLRAKVAELEGKQSAVDAKRAAEDTVERFIRDRLDPDFPREIARRFLPATADAAVLDRELSALNTAMKDYVGAMVKSGKLRWVDSEAPGHAGKPAAAEAPKSPAQLITEGLRSRARKRGAAPEPQSRIDGTNPILSR